MTCFVQVLGHIRPLAGLAMQSWSVLVLHEYFQLALLVLVQLLGRYLLHQLHFLLRLYIQKYLCSTRATNNTLITSHDYLIRMKDRG